MAALQSSFMKGFSEAYLADLGRVVAAWSHVELKFDILFLSHIVFQGKTSLPSSDPKLKMMGLSFERRVKALRDHLNSKHLNPDLCRRWDRALSQLMQLRRERDEIAHAQFEVHIIGEEGSFVIDPDSANALYKSWRNQKRHQRRNVNRSTLLSIFQRMEALYWDLGALTLDPESPVLSERRS